MVVDLFQGPEGDRMDEAQTEDAGVFETVERGAVRGDAADAVAPTMDSNQSDAELFRDARDDRSTSAVRANHFVHRPAPKTLANGETVSGGQRTAFDGYRNVNDRCMHVYSTNMRNSEEKIYRLRLMVS